MISNELKEQDEYIKRVSKITDLYIKDHETKPKFLIQTFGCAQNENDSERIKSFLIDMGYQETENTNDANLILFNTCAVRGGAEERVFGNLGALKNLKSKKNDLIIGICGCMMQQEKIVNKIKNTFRHVDIVFGTHTLYTFPVILYNALMDKKRVFNVIESDGQIIEGLKQERKDKFKALVSVMYGCNNYCSYCIVPYVRGRERSREKESILEEIRELAFNGYKEITLLGQNVNSYANDLNENYDFADLIREINNIDGIKRIKFLTSHPKDISEKLIYTMAECENVCKYLHLPFQSGSNRILKQMNRKYTKEKYLETIFKVKDVMGDISLTSDVIIGFPNETYEDVKETIDLIEQVKFDNLFTFIFSPREGTPAAKMIDHVSNQDKHKHFDMLLEAQKKISKEINESYINKVVEVLVDGPSKNNKDVLSGRTVGSKIVNFTSKDAKEGDLVFVKITDTQTWALLGEQI